MSLLRRVLHIPDCHAPFYNKSAFRLMIDVAKDFKPHEIVILGDFFDFYSVSRHDKDPLIDFKTWKDELEEAREALFWVEQIKGVKSWVFMEGNHEARLQAYIANHAPKLAGIYKTKELLCLDDKWKWFPYGQEGHYKIGGLTVCHGSRAGENPAASMVKKYRSSVLFGHVHKIQEYHITDINGRDWVGLSPGWLGDQRRAANYIKDVSDWSLGFGLTWHRQQSDTFYHQLVNIVDSPAGYSCFYNGDVKVGR